MRRRDWLQITAASAVFGQAEPKPNIVVLLADDLGVGDVGAYNLNSVIRTPNLDRLAAEGVRFTDAHSPSSVCTPTRYGILTGRYAWRSRLKKGVLQGTSPNLIETDRLTLPKFLARAGYRTGGFGKWHLGLGDSEPVDYSQEFRPGPLDHGFEEYFGIPASLDMPPYVYIDGRRAVEAPTDSIPDNGETKRGPYWRGGPRAPGFRMEEVLPKIIDRAERFLAKSRTDRRPFFAYIPMPAPHTPWVPTKEFQGKSKAHLYGDFVEQVDASIGRVLAALEATGQASNTLVIATSDNAAPWEKRDSEENGGHWANLFWRGQKADAYEGGHRVPFLFRWPGRARAGAVSEASVCLTDLFATTAAATGLPLPADCAEDSFNALPGLPPGAGRTSIRPHLVHHANNGMFALREGNWKWIAGLGSGGFTLPVTRPAGAGPTSQLFDVAKDPYERDDVAAANPAVVERMARRLAEIQNAGRTRP